MNESNPFVITIVAIVNTGREVRMKTILTATNPSDPDWMRDWFVYGFGPPPLSAEAKEKYMELFL